MSIAPSALSPLKQSILTQFETTVGRAANDDEIQNIHDKDVRRGSGVFCVFKAGGEWMVAFSVQGTEYETAGRYVGTGGGLHDDDDESAREAAVRELRQEVVDDNNNPILIIHPDRLEETVSNINVSMLLPGAAHPEFNPVIEHNFFVILNSDEALNLLHHQRRLNTDPAYAAASYAHTNQEIGGMVIMPLSEALLPENRDQLAQKLEREGLRVMAQRLVHG